MVLCAIVGCSNRSGKGGKKTNKEGKKISFYRIPAVIRHTDKRDLELSTKRRDGYLAAISREDFTVDILENSDYRVCSEHFVDGEPAKLYEYTKSNWLPSLNLGHTKQRNNPDNARYDRAKRRTDEQRMRDEEDQLLTQQAEEVGMAELDVANNK